MTVSRAAASLAVSFALSGLAASAAAADICGETVPTNRYIDGLPAYAQCAGSMTGAVYSNDGINTATASGGTDWIRTQGSGGYQCTELAHRYLYFRWNVTSVPNGNAGVWCDATIPAGVEKVTTPVHGDLIVFAPGSCGADPTTGHVAVVDVVNADGSVSAVQQNVASRSKYAASCAACFLHVIANDGTVPDGGVVTPPDAGGSGAAGTTGGAGTTGATGGGGRSGGAGSRGTAGASASGAAGASGTTGAGGAAGTSGAAGVAGTTGTTGTGTAGTTGAAGVAGATGAAGVAGATGTTGAAGAAGTAGTTGAGGDGTAGAPGESPTALSGGCACGVGLAGDGRDADLGALALLAIGAAVSLRRRRAPRG